MGAGQNRRASFSEWETRQTATRSGRCFERQSKDAGFFRGNKPKTGRERRSAIGDELAEQGPGVEKGIAFSKKKTWKGGREKKLRTKSRVPKDLKDKESGKKKKGNKREGPRRGRPLQTGAREESQARGGVVEDNRRFAKAVL